MKKIFSMFMLGLLLLLSSCTSSDSSDEVTKVTKYISDLNSYSLASTMTINRVDKNVSINVSVDYLTPSYYKVSFKSQDGNEQIIIKNAGGVYVLTPSLNKEFKFDSDWPLNSSHAYLLEAINKDIKADSTATGVTESEEIKIECAIQHKTNQNLAKMRYTCSSSDLKPKNTVFLNDKGDEVIKVDFNTFTPNSKLTEDYFSEKKYLTEQEEGPTSGEEESTMAEVAAGYELEGNSLKASTTAEDTIILCYSGEKPYTIIVQKAIAYSEVVAISNYDSIEILDSGLCFLNDSSMKYYLNDYEITIYSTALSVEEYLNIASAITLV